MKPLVSILIPAYNAEEYLAETLDSALAQTWDNLEIIVVDDGSQDNTLAIAKQYESKIVKIIHQSNQGQSASENRALEAAQGDFIQYLDADDLLAPDKIERQIQLLGDSNSPYVTAGEWARFYHTPAEARFIPQVLWADFSPIDWLVTAWEGSYMMHGAAWLIPRTISDRAGGWNANLSLINDFEYFSRILLASEGVKFCWGAKTYYRSGSSENLSGSTSYAAWKSAVLSMKLGTQHLLSVENSPRTRQTCANALQSLIYTIYPDAPDLRQNLDQQIQQLGGSNLPMPGGPALQILCCLVGWQRAKSLQKQIYHYGYQKLALGWRFSQWTQKLAYQARTGNEE
ncbi:glycosyltransferase family 2 protein [Leptolyngbya sp. GGD]|uniref:glycosyltransferase family 2 protein n=1 Tax=Leptolyngbya sp. GGD TaxID=2997907 RepID=UPI002279F8D5|nr:glycosyltransferase family A protein [Leptolyngbya sp. GGD]MCY6489309.1 glycosyltransferase family A protein [Leptolyngbya sp. GGD]